jgi:hypothetical protein
LEIQDIDLQLVWETENELNVIELENKTLE